jgi:hypothetical protein
MPYEPEIELDERKIEFIAILPAIQSAISLSGNGDGARIKLDIPETFAGAAVLLATMYSGKSFKVTIEPDD